MKRELSYPFFYLPYILLASEESSYDQRKVGLLACASLYSNAFPSRRRHRFLRQWLSLFHQHLQLRKQLRIFTEFPIKLNNQRLHPAILIHLNLSIS